MQNNFESFSHEFLELKKHRKDFVVVTISNTRGSAPQDLGARMIVTREGLHFGTIGGGKVENHCLEFASNLLGSNVTKIAKTWNLQKDIGMTCGGEVSFLFENESSASTWDIAIFGAGHVSQQLTRTLLNLNCKLTVIDNRLEWLEKLPKHSKLRTIHNLNMEKEVKNLSDHTFVASMTMGHAKDVPILKEALKRNFPFLGVIGSLSKRNAMTKELIEMGVCASDCEKFTCPIGEPIGTNDPAEIAISITAQLLKFRDKIN